MTGTQPGPQTAESGPHTAKSGHEAQRRYDVEVVHLLVSGTHHYFGRPKNGPTGPTTRAADSAEVVAGKGVRGDRFFGKAAHMDAAVTLLAVEALDAVAAELGIPPFDPLAARRNIVLRGAELGPLLGHELVLEQGAVAVRLAARRPASPCAWMDRVLAPGAHHALRGRAGLRCSPLSSGVLRPGPAVLVSPVPLDVSRAGEAVVRRHRLP